MTHISIAKKAVAGSDDPRSGNENENLDVMNDQTKSDTARSHTTHPEKKVGGSMTMGRWDEKKPEENRRVRTSEPYLTWLGQCLRQSYEETLNEPVPEQFHDLLNRLEQEDDKSST